MSLPSPAPLPPPGPPSTSVRASPRPMPTAAWYQDPADPLLLRYWDGRSWTPHTADTPGTRPEDRRGEHPRLTISAAVGVLVVLTASLIGNRFLLDVLVRYEWPLFVYMGISVLVAYGPSIVWCWYASRRWGAGQFREDIGLRVRWADTGWGPLTWVAAITAQLAVSALVLGLDIPLIGNTEGIDGLDADRNYVIALLFAAVVAAPVVEEIVFRGVVLRGFLAVMPAAAAIGLQGVLFGAAHIDPIRGTGNIGLVLILSAVGVVLGVSAYLLHRIAAVMIAHAIFNGVVMTIVLTGWADSGSG